MAFSGVALAFIGALAIGTGLLFGLFPALRSTRPDLATVPGSASRDNRPGRDLPAGSARRSPLSRSASRWCCWSRRGLFTKSLYNVSRVDLGLEVDHLVTFGISPERNGYTSEQSRALFERLEDELGGGGCPGSPA